MRAQRKRKPGFRRVFVNRIDRSSYSRSSATLILVFRRSSLTIDIACAVARGLGDLLAAHLDALFGRWLWAGSPGVTLLTTNTMKRPPGHAPCVRPRTCPCAGTGARNIASATSMSAPAARHARDVRRGQSPRAVARSCQLAPRAHLGQQRRRRGVGGAWPRGRRGSRR